jgi:hypothetical protein
MFIFRKMKYFIYFIFAPPGTGETKRVRTSFNSFVDGDTISATPYEHDRHNFEGAA